MSTAPTPEEHIQDSLDRQSVGPPLRDVERALIVRTLFDLGGNRTQAARVLGISVRGLRDKIRQFKRQGVTIPEPPGGHSA
jgi:DNA-binding NtrC family response regulator